MFLEQRLVQVSNASKSPPSRVNFLKYQKPEKDLSFIKNSDVYKLIHDQDAPKCGIELRPELVIAEEDVRKVMHDETIFQPRKDKAFLYQNWSPFPSSKNIPQTSFTQRKKTSFHSFHLSHRPSTSRPTSSWLAYFPSPDARARWIVRCPEITPPTVKKTVCIAVLKGLAF